MGVDGDLGMEGLGFSERREVEHAAQAISTHTLSFSQCLSLSTRLWEVYLSVLWVEAERRDYSVGVSGQDSREGEWISCLYRQTIPGRSRGERRKGLVSW